MISAIWFNVVMGIIGVAALLLAYFAHRHLPKRENRAEFPELSGIRISHKISDLAAFGLPQPILTMPMQVIAVPRRLLTRQIPALSEIFTNFSCLRPKIMLISK